MSDFNYQEYLRNNPLLKEEVKDQLITESQEVEEVEIPSASLTKVNAEVKNIQTLAQAMLDFFNQVKEKENVDFESNAKMKVVLDKLNTLAKTEETVEETVEESAPGYIGDESLEAVSKMGTADMNLWHVVKLIDAGILQDSEKIKALKALDPAFKVNEEEVTKEEIQEEVTEETSSKMKVSELKAKIKEDILSVLSEAEEEVDVDVDVEDEVEVEAGADDIEIERPGVKTTVNVGLSPEEEIVQDSLKAAMDAANELGNQKLADQIGNTITFFTREFVVGQNTD